MRSFRSGLAVLAFCVAMLTGVGKSGAILHHSHATLDDSIITTIINTIVDLESRMSLPPG